MDREVPSKKIYVGGQAVIEGVMMRGPEYVATAVREPGGGIVVKKTKVSSLSARFPILKKPMLRGMVALYESLLIGMKSLMFSAQAAGEEEEALSDQEIYMTMAFSTLFAIVLFLAIPTYAAKFIPGLAGHPLAMNLAEGVIRLVIFLAYLYGISLTKDIQRVFEYHGAEHKTIFCYEKNLPMTVDNVRVQPRLHPRCGTNFLLMVVVISIFVFAFLGWPSLWERIVSRVLLMPVVAGLAYEWIRMAAETTNPILQALVRPGLWLQLITTREPHDDQIEVAIRALEEVKPAEEAAETASAKEVTGAYVAG